jgi:nitroimidazol reductase NimA-like FMN-containing flavoprotein (pyridoxamine 5'-phosphate oxidase superfamily)
MANKGETERTRLRREPTRAVKDQQVLYRIIDESLVCHVGFVVDARPVVIPTLGWRVGDDIYIHGSRGSRMLTVFENGGEASITFTVLDGLAMARSAFHHSANYRSVVVFGKPELVEDRQTKLDVMEVFMENIAPGRWDELRATNDKEIKATDVYKLSLNETSVKMRTGDPIDDDADLNDPVWADVNPIQRKLGPSTNAADNFDTQSTPDLSAVFRGLWTDE